MNKKMKIITLILSCVLLIGAAVGITVSAADGDPDATVKLEGQNISYEGAVRVAYYLSTANLGANQSVKLLVSDKKFDVPANITTPTGYIVKDVEDKVEFKDKDGNVTATYDIAYSNGIAPKELRDDIYAMAVVVNADGSVAARSAKKIYSPYKYAMNRFNALNKLNPEPETSEAIQKFDQLNLYTALLNYGGAVQDVLMTEDEIKAAGGYADEYIIVKQQTVVNGTPVDASFSKRGTELGNTPTLFTHEVSRWQKIYDKDGNLESENKKVIFTGFTNADGESYLGENYSANWNKLNLTPGNHTINANYTTVDGQYVDYDGYINENATSLNDYKDKFFVGAQSGTYTNYEKNNDALQTFTKGDYTYTYVARGQALIKDGALVAERALVITAVSKGEEKKTGLGEGFEDSYKVGDVATDSAAKTGNMVIMHQYNTNSPELFKAATKNVYETDLVVDFDRAGGGGHIGQFWITNGVGSADYVWGVDINGKSNNESYSLNIARPNSVEGVSNYYSGGAVVADNLEEGRTYNIRIETFCNVTGRESMLIKFYIDGVKLGEYITYYNPYRDANGAGVFESLKFGIPSNGRDCRFYFDNTYAATEEYNEGDYRGVGKYNESDKTVNFSGGEPGLVVAPGTLYGNGDFDKKYNSTSNYVGHTYVKDADGDTSLQIGVRNSSSGSMQIMSVNKYGDTYVFATDFMWHGSQAYNSADSGGTDPWYIRIGFRSIGARTGGDDNLFYIQGLSGAGAAGGQYVGNRENPDSLYLYADSTTNVSTAYSDTNYIAELERGVWYNIRVEYVPKSYTEGKTITDTTTSGTKGTYPAAESVGIYYVFINDTLVFNEQYTATESMGEGLSNVNNKSFDHVYFQGRAGGIVEDFSYSLDNTYCSAISKDSNTDVEDENGYASVGYLNGLDYSLDSLANENDGFTLSDVKLNESNYNANDKATVGLRDWARIAAEGSSKVLEVGSQTTESPLIRWSSQGGSGSTYVYSTDLKWLGSSAMENYRTIGGKKYSNADDRWLFKLGLTSSASNNNDNYIVPLFGWAYGNDSVELRLGVGSDAVKLAVLNASEWYDLSVEYTPIDGNGYRGRVVVKLNLDVIYDGVYSGKTGVSNADFTGAFIEYRGVARNVVMRFDNTFVGTVKPYEKNGGASYEDATHFDEEGYTHSASTAESTRAEIVNNNGDKYLLAGKTDAAQQLAFVKFANNENTLYNNGKYLFEMDMKVLSENFAMSEGYKDEWFVKLRIHNVEGLLIDAIFLYPIYNAEGKLSYVRIANNPADGVIYAFSADEWHNIRIEYTTDGNTSLTKDIYVDGQNVATGLGQHTSADDELDAVTTGYSLALIESRMYASNFEMNIDNVAVGYVSEELDNLCDTETNRFNSSSDAFGVTAGSFTSAGIVNADDGNYYNASAASNKTGEKTMLLADGTNTLVPIAPGAVYVFEMDMRVDDLVSAVYTYDEATNTYKIANNGSSWWSSISFSDSATSHADNNSWGFGNSIGGTTVYTDNTSTVTINGEEVVNNKTTIYKSEQADIMGKSFNLDEWVSVRLELEIHTITGNDVTSATLKGYVNGELANTSTSATCAKYFQVTEGVRGVWFKYKSVGTAANSGLGANSAGTGWASLGSGSQKINSFENSFDNIKLYSYYAESSSFTYDFEGESPLLPTFGGEKKIQPSSMEVSSEDGNKFLDITGPNSSELILEFTDTEDALGQAQVNSVYVLNYKMRINNLVPTSSYVTNSNPWWTYAGGIMYKDTYVGDTSATSITSLMIIPDEVKNGTTAATNENIGVKIGSVAVEKSEWVDVKLVLVVTAIDSATEKISVTYKLYVNGTYAGGASTSKTGTDIKGFGAKFKGAGNFASKYEIDLDDISITAYNTVPTPVEETPAE